MSKGKDDVTPIKAKVEAKPLPPSEPMPPTGCVICGSFEGKLDQAAGHARWHAECGAAHPDVIARVKARA